jgi:hypothetical protein
VGYLRKVCRLLYQTTHSKMEWGNVGVSNLIPYPSANHVAATRQECVRRDPGSIRLRAQSYCIFFLN